MNKGLILTIFVLAAIFCLGSVSALKCYDCKVPNQDCLLNYHNKVTECDSELFSSAISSVTGQKKVCVKYAVGEFSARGCFVENFCDNKEHCSSCDSDLCNSADIKISSKLAMATSALMLVLCKLFY